MADSSDACESDASAADGSLDGRLSIASINRLQSVQQENTVLKIELEAQLIKYRALSEENKRLRKASVSIQAKAEQEEEFISNTLFKKISKLKKEKEILATKYEEEEEYLTNDLSRKLLLLSREKVELEHALEQEQERMVASLVLKNKKLETEVNTKQALLDQLRKEKVDLENALEQEQEQVVNRLWKRMKKIEEEKRRLQGQLNHPISEPVSPRDMQTGDDQLVTNLTSKIEDLNSEVAILRHQLSIAQIEHARKIEHLSKEEMLLREQNLILQKKLAREKERSEALNRQLSESESSLEMDDERYFNVHRSSFSNTARTRAESSPIPVALSPSHSKSLSTGLNIQVGSPTAKVCPQCGAPNPNNPLLMSSPPSSCRARFFSGSRDDTNSSNKHSPVSSSSSKCETS